MNGHGQCSRRWIRDGTSGSWLSLHLERKIALALTIPPECRGKQENVMGRRKRDEKELLTLQGTVDERTTSVVE